MSSLAESILHIKFCVILFSRSWDLSIPKILEKAALQNYLLSDFHEKFSHTNMFHCAKIFRVSLNSELWLLTHSCHKIFVTHMKTTNVYYPKNSKTTLRILETVQINQKLEKIIFSWKLYFPCMVYVQKIEICVTSANKKDIFKRSKCIFTHKNKTF